MNEYMGVKSDACMSMNSHCVVTAVWLNTSHRSQDGIPGSPGCKVNSAVVITGHCVK